MTLPKAVTSSTKTPGFYLTINMLAGAANPGSAALRGLLIGHKITGGDIVAQTEVRQCFGPDDVKTACGEGSLAHLAAIQAFLAFGKLSLDVVAPTAPTGGTATVTHTISGTPTDNNVFVIDVAGRKTGDITWAAGESISTFRARCVAAINTVRPLPTTASNGVGGAGDIQIDAKGPGVWGNDITTGITKKQGTGGVITAGGSKLASGTGEYDLTTVLGLVQTTEYGAIGVCTSNADATDATTSSNAERLMAHIESHKLGLGALLQYGFVGHTGSIANVKAGAIGRNSVDMSYAYLQLAQSLPSELMGWDFGDSMRWYQERANYNRIGNRAPGIVGSKDPAADKLIFNEGEDLLSNGVSPYDFVTNSKTDVALIAPITTHSLDSASAADYRAYYQSDSFGVNAVMRDLRTALPQEFPNASITQDLPPGADELPPGVVERKDVYNFVTSRLNGWAIAGVIDKNYLQQVIDDGSLAVEIDDTDKSQVNIFIPGRIVKPLAKFSAVFAKTG